MQSSGLGMRLQCPSTNVLPCWYIVYLKVIFIFTLIGGEPGSIAVYIRLPTRNYSIVVVYTPPGLKKRQKEA